MEQLSVLKQQLFRFQNRKGIGTILTILGGIMTVAIPLIALTNWQSSIINSSAPKTLSFDNVGEKLEMLSAMEDRWKQIDGMNSDELTVVTNQTTKYGKYIVSEQYSAVGKYNALTGKCETGTPDEKEKICRTVELSVSGPTTNLPLGEAQTTRVASAMPIEPKFKDEGGHVEFDNGLVIQYGVIKNVSLCERWYDVSFPKAFAYKTMGVSVTLAPIGGSYIDLQHPKGHPQYGFVYGNIAPMIKGGSITTTGMKIGADIYGAPITDPPAVYGDIFWMAVGI